MAKYSLEFKMKVVVEYLSGNIGLEILAKKHKIKSAEQVKRWIKAYQNLGIQGLKRSRNNRSYSVDFKLKAITMYETSEKSYQDVANELGLNNPTLIFSWRKAYHEQGIDGLSRKRGRATLSKKDPANKAKVPSSKPPNEITEEPSQLRLSPDACHAREGGLESEPKENPAPKPAVGSTGQKLRS